MSEFSDWVLLEAAKEGAEKIVEVATGLAGKVVMLPVEGISKAVESSDKETLASVSKRMGNCPHLFVIPMDWDPPSVRCQTVVLRKKRGCAFSCGGTVIYHAQSDIDIKGLSTWVIRWDRHTRKPALNVLGTRACLQCEALSRE